ncbi:MAG: glycosyltransferase [Opitutaceae bacterium]|jgi:hypothetical protein
MVTELTRIVVVFDQWDYVRRWIGDSSLFTDRRIAWMVVNDAPHAPCPDDLRAIFATRSIRLVENAFNLGRSETRNSAARLADSPWIEFIDGDDLPLSIDLDALPDHKGNQLLHFAHRTYRLVGNRVEISTELEPPHPLYWEIVLIRHLPPLTCRPACLIFPREHFLAIGGFDGRFDTCEDLHLIWKLDQTGISVAMVNVPKQLYRIAGGQSIDPEVIGFYTHRLLRLAARSADDSSAADGIDTHADAQALRAIRSLHEELTAHYARSPSRHIDTRRDVSDLFWRARDTFLRECRPGLTHRLREALKLVLRR